jgi:hypothetical protein
LVLDTGLEAVRQISPQCTSLCNDCPHLGAATLTAPSGNTLKRRNEEFKNEEFKKIAAADMQKRKIAETKNRRNEEFKNEESEKRRIEETKNRRNEKFKNEESKKRRIKETKNCRNEELKKRRIAETKNFFFFPWSTWIGPSS